MYTSEESLGSRQESSNKCISLHCTALQLHQQEELFLPPMTSTAWVLDYWYNEQRGGLSHWRLIKSKKEREKKKIRNAEAQLSSARFHNPKCWMWRGGIWVLFQCGSGRIRKEWSGENIKKFSLNSMLWKIVAIWVYNGCILGRLCWLCVYRDTEIMIQYIIIL